jgi:hypothetical protein
VGLDLMNVQKKEIIKHQMVKDAPVHPVIQKPENVFLVLLERDVCLE